MLDTIPQTALAAVSHIAGMATAAAGGSLIDYGRVTHVEPTTLVDEGIMHLQYMPDIMQSLCSLFSAYYLQAISLSTMSVNGIQVRRILDHVNPNRSVQQAATAIFNKKAGIECFCLPTPERVTGLEAYGLPAFGLEEGNYARTVNEISNLSVGKLLDVEIKINEQSVKIPVQVRLVVTPLTSEVMVHTLSVGNKDTSLKERYHGFMSGQLTFIKDLILCQDLIDEHRRTLMNDKSGTYTQMLARTNANTAASVLTGTPSLAQASNIVVISEKTAKSLEGVVLGRLGDVRTREKIFKETYIMLMVVVDTVYEMVTIYSRGIENPTVHSVRDLKGASKDTGVDIAKLLQAYNAGATPTL